MTIVAQLPHIAPSSLGSPALSPFKLWSSGITVVVNQVGVEKHFRPKNFRNFLPTRRPEAAATQVAARPELRPSDVT